MRIFVTGGTGFIGSHLVPLLEERGHQLALYHRKDVNNLDSILSDFQPEVAFHLAWEGLPDYSWPVCMKNLQLGLEFYEKLLQNSCRKIITTGSCWEYGNLNSFIATKTALRLMGETLFSEKEFQFIWTRLFFVYGPGQRETSLIPSVIKKIRNKQKPELKNPNTCHDFIYVKDVAKALVLLAEKPMTAKMVDIGSGQLHSVGDVAQCVLQLMSNETPSRREVSEVDKGGEAGGVDVFHADTSNLTQLGWKPAYDLIAGIRETIQ